MTYIYGLRRKGDTQFRYVGKANDPQARLAAHMTEAFRDHVRTHKNNWLRSVGRKDVEYVVLEEVSSEISGKSESATGLGTFEQKDTP